VSIFTRGYSPKRRCKGKNIAGKIEVREVLG